MPFLIPIAMEPFNDLLNAIGVFILVMLAIVLIAAAFRWATKKLSDNIESNQKAQQSFNASTKAVIDSLVEVSKKHEESNKQFAKTNEYLMDLGKASKDRDEAQNQILHELIAANNINRGKCETHMGITVDHGKRILIIEKKVTDIAEIIKYQPKKLEDARQVN